MIKVLRTMATGVAVGLLLAVTPTAAHARNIGHGEQARALDADPGVLEDVRGLVGAPVSL
ncbi:hypothetical protein [Streptomyces sp. NPDC046727]|uniref:hypothetical protein n=1 Tax=Streptomyces sp. NPDC046727 TaxID=3155373 RepID=UPI0033F879BF